MKSFKETFNESKLVIEGLDKDTERKFKISMNVIKRALGKDVPSKEDLEEFIDIEVEKNKFDKKDYSKYVLHNIKHK